MSALHGVQNALVLRCPCDILPLFVLQPKIQLRFRFMFDILLMIFKKIYSRKFFKCSFLASYRDFAVQSETYCHKDSLFKDKVKPMHALISCSYIRSRYLFFLKLSLLNFYIYFYGFFINFFYRNLDIELVYFMT